MEFWDILIKVLPDFLGDALHAWVDIVVKATPQLGHNPNHIMITSGFLILWLGWQYLNGEHY